MSKAYGEEVAGDIRLETPSSGDISLSNRKSKKKLQIYPKKAKGKEQLQPHPFFGNLNRKELGGLIYKHPDHRLKQFSSLMI